MFQRGSVFYAEETATGKQISLRTKDEEEALTLLNTKNEATRQPAMNLQIAQVYLQHADPTNCSPIPNRRCSGSSMTPALLNRPKNSNSLLLYECGTIASQVAQNHGAFLRTNVFHESAGH